MLQLFRLASLAEGISLLIILSVTMGWISRDYVYVLGMTHGVLFLFYCVLSLPVSHRQGWSVLTWLLVLGAAFIPFAFVLVERFLKQDIKRSEKAA